MPRRKRVCWGIPGSRSMRCRIVFVVEPDLLLRTILRNHACVRESDSPTSLLQEG
jgi:hypothetical protein